ncbi:hypothetical protein DRP53_00390 [candidate division WOR-3 bacterium]|uniref:Uncharacterized protein n=1 Tax=candidate division WOR-3 bacterium TaxID=2052148 RepID=A0A660SLU5_UNCW3|nr:MAG: hypothetical protein DRP53_00390 [candidate division WOR-3 bacterium]
MIILLFLLPITDSIAPADPVAGDGRWRIGLLIENRFLLKELSGSKLSLYGRGFRFLVSGFGLGPLQIYQLRIAYSFSLIEPLDLGYGIATHLYRFDDGNSHLGLGIDLGLGYTDELITVRLSSLDLNRPRLTPIDEIRPGYHLKLRVGKNPQFHFKLTHRTNFSIYSGFTLSLPPPLSLSLGFNTEPRELSFGFSIITRPEIYYTGSIHSTLGLSHQIGIRI